MNAYHDWDISNETYPKNLYNIHAWWTLKNTYLIKDAGLERMKYLVGLSFIMLVAVFKIMIATSQWEAIETINNRLMPIKEFVIIYKPHFTSYSWSTTDMKLDVNVTIIKLLALLE